MKSRRYEEYWSVGSPAALADPLTPARRALLWKRAFDDHGTVRRLLDCGAGDGALVAEACERGFDAVGIEISASAIERGRRNHPGIDMRLHSVEQLPWPVEPASWDIVVSFEVIEHLLEPRALLQGAHLALVPGGSLVLSTPYHGMAKNLAIAAVRFEKHFAVDGEHVRFFTDRALTGLLDESGFDVVEVSHLGRFRTLWANTVVWATRRA